MTETSDISALREWYAKEYARRTTALETGNGRIDWIAPDYRVSWSEICTKAGELGITIDPITLRQIWSREP